MDWNRKKDRQLIQNRIKLMIIDDSVVYRSWLIGNLEKDPRSEIVRYAINAFDAGNRIPVLKPDVLTLDIEMPDMSGLDFLKEYLPSHPTPVILVSSLNVRAFNALVAGAVDFIRKPDVNSHVLKEAFLSMLMAKLAAVAVPRVRIPPAAPASPPSVKMPALRTSLSTRLAACRDMVVAIRASTGGTEAILEALRQFSENMPGVVITQHMPAGFTAMYAGRLNRLCKMEVHETKSGDRLRPDLALLASSRLQMKVVRMGNGYVVSCAHREKVNGHCPSMDVLFGMVSSIVRNKAMGILLTDMGAGGAAGLLRMRKNGAYTTGQDRDTYTVYDMPMEAYKIGVVCQQSPLSSIPQLVINKLTQLWRNAR